MSDPTDILPSGLPEQIKNVASVVITVARREGWIFQEIRLAHGTVSVVATSPTGDDFSLSCGQNVFLDRLRAAIRKNARTAGAQ